MSQFITSLTSRENNVGVQIFSDVHIALHDGIEGSLVNACCLHTDQARRKEHLWTAESLTADRDDLQSSLSISQICMPECVRT